MEKDELKLEILERAPDFQAGPTPKPCTRTRIWKKGEPGMGITGT